MLRGVGSALTHANLALIAAALALHVTGLIITGERWRVVIAGLGTRLPLSRTTLINLAGIFVRNATPTTGLGGDHRHRRRRRCGGTVVESRAPSRARRVVMGPHRTSPTRSPIVRAGGRVRDAGTGRDHRAADRRGGGVRAAADDSTIRDSDGA